MFLMANVGYSKSQNIFQVTSWILVFEVATLHLISRPTTAQKEADILIEKLKYLTYH
jgi:hypothetical protein